MCHRALLAPLLLVELAVGAAGVCPGGGSAWGCRGGPSSGIVAGNFSGSSEFGCVVGPNCRTLGHDELAYGGWSCAPSTCEVWHEWASGQAVACCAAWEGTATELLADAWLDYGEFYSCRTMLWLGGGLGAAAILANTPLDERLQDWHDRNVRGRPAGRVANFFEPLGHGEWMFPAFAGAALIGNGLRTRWPVAGPLGDWGSRCLRSVAVGGPPLLVLCPLLGASRPNEGLGSHWKPFDDSNSVSGHAFVGAIPFLNAAMMTDDAGSKVVLYGLSIMPAWSRVNDRKHYLSQALLGWWLAWLAADVVDRTELSQRNFLLLPQADERGLGVQVVYRW